MFYRIAIPRVCASGPAIVEDEAGSFWLTVARTVANLDTQSGSFRLFGHQATGQQQGAG